MQVQAVVLQLIAVITGGGRLREQRLEKWRVCQQCVVDVAAVELQIAQVVLCNAGIYFGWADAGCVGCVRGHCHAPQRAIKRHILQPGLHYGKYAA